MVWNIRGIFRKNNQLSVNEHSMIEVSNSSARYIQIVIYQKGFPVLVGYGMNGKASLLLSRAGLDLKGSASFDARGYTKRGSEMKLTGNIEIV